MLRRRRSSISKHLPAHIRATRAEPGCLEFRVEQTADALVWEVAERFVDRAAFDHHQARVQASTWRRVTAHIRREYTVVEE